jgi:type 1 glutamine amidotransferase
MRIVASVNLVFLFAILACGPVATGLGEDHPYRMPEYADSEPPPPRTLEEVTKLLAGASKAAESGKTAAAPLKLVLVAGPKDHGKGEHDYPAWQKVWSRLLAKADKTTVDTAWEFPSAKQIRNADVLVFYQHGAWNDQRAAAIDPFLARGGGLVFIHWAIDGQGQHDQMAKRIGIAAPGGKIRFRHGELNLDFSSAAGNPITRNFSNIRWTDESYWLLVGDPARVKLLGTSLEDSKPQPQIWTTERGKGRVFVSIPGHFMWTFDDPAYRILIFRGIAWAGRRDVDRFNKLVLLDARVQ